MKPLKKLQKSYYRGILMKYNFKLEKYDYYEPHCDLSSEDECYYLVDWILNRSDAYIADAIQEIADNSVDIYNHDLEQSLKNTSLFEYIGRAIRDYELKPDPKEDGYDYIMRIIRCGQYLFFEESLYQNLNTIAQNALVSYVNSITLTSNIIYDADELKKFIESYIEELSVDNNDRVSSIIEDFNNELLSNFDVKIN